MKAIKYVLLMIAIYHAPALAVEYEVIPGTSLRVNSAIPLAYDYATNETIPWPTGGSGAAGVREGYNLTTPKGTKIPVTVTHTLPKASVSKAGAGLLKFAGPVGVITTAITLGQLVWDAGLGEWVLPSPGYDETGDGFINGYYWKGPYASTLKKESGLAVCLALNDGSITFNDFRYNGPSSGDCKATQNGVWYQNWAVRVQCPTNPDASYPLTCATGGYNPPSIPATDAQIEQAVSDGIGSDSEKARAVAQAAQDNGFPPMADGQPQASGPTVVEGPSLQTVQSGPNGQTTINETTNYYISYGGDTITVIEETTTTTTAPDGTTETETTTKEPPDTVPDGALEVTVDLPNDYATESTSNLILEAIQGLKGAFDSVTNAMTSIYEWLTQPVPEEPIPPLPDPPIEAVEPPGLITDLNSYLTDLDETAACAPDYTISILGASVVLPMQPFCDLADLARPLNQIFFIIFAMLAFFRIYAR
jgi:hypothetical protein